MIKSLILLGVLLVMSYPDFKVLELAERGVNHNDDYLVVVDFTLPSNSKRFWVLDKDRKIKYQTYVASGKNSGPDGNLKFSNIPESKMSSLGFMMVGEYYEGKHGPSLRLHGLEKGFNDKVLPRAIVIHTATYAKVGGRSWGCLAIDPVDGHDIIKLLRNKQVTVFVYYPDKDYLSNSKILNNHNE